MQLSFKSTVVIELTIFTMGIRLKRSSSTLIAEVHEMEQKSNHLVDFIKN